MIGVVADNKYTGVREKPVPTAWFPYAQVEGGTMHVELRTAGDPTAFWPAIRRAVSEYAPGLPLLRPTTQQAEFDETISGERLVARLALCFGVVAVVLVATGLYGCSPIASAAAPPNSGSEWPWARNAATSSG